MVQKIDIAYKIDDTRGNVKKENFDALGISGNIKDVRIVDSYTIDESFSKQQLRKIAGALSNPLIEEFSINKSWAPKDFDWVVEIGYLPGVTDNVGATARETIEDLLKKKFSCIFQNFLCVTPVPAANFQYFWIIFINKLKRFFYIGNTRT